MHKFLLQFLLAVICLWQTACSAAENPNLHPDGMTQPELRAIFSGENRHSIELWKRLNERTSQTGKEFALALCDVDKGPEELRGFEYLAKANVWPYLLTIEEGEISNGVSNMDVPVHAVLRYKYHDKLKWLLEYGADVESLSVASLWNSRPLLCTPLYMAVKLRDKQAVSILLAAGAEIHSGVRELIAFEFADQKIKKMIEDEVVGRLRWQGGEGLREAWAKASVSGAMGAAVPVGHVTAEDLK